MLPDLLFYLLSEQLSRVGAPGTRPEEADVVLHDLELTLRLRDEHDPRDARDRSQGEQFLEFDLVSEYLRTNPEAFSEETDAWFLERAARESPNWPSHAGPDAVALRYVTTADPWNRYLATAAQLSARSVNGRAGETLAPSVAPIARALLEVGERKSEERAEAIAELTDIVIDLSLSDPQMSASALRELVRLVREYPGVQEYNPVARVLSSRADELGGEDARVLRSFAGLEREQ